MKAKRTFNQLVTLHSAPSTSGIELLTETHTLQTMYCLKQWRWY